MNYSISYYQSYKTEDFQNQKISIEVGRETTDKIIFFEALPNKLMEEKETKEILTKWGLLDTLRIGTFRYNQQFQEYDIPRFLRDLVNNPNVRYVVNNLKWPQEAIATVQFEKLRCSELTLQVFDELEKEEIVKKGYISKMMSDYYEEIEICDKVRECLLLEQSETYCVFTEVQRKEFLLKIFQLLVVGGSFNQYEDMIEPYLSWTKKFYKSLVSVRKRQETNEIFVQSLFFSIKSLDEGKSYKKGYHPQSIFYVLVNPSLRTVHILTNDWKKYW